MGLGASLMINEYTIAHWHVSVTVRLVVIIIFDSEFDLTGLCVKEKTQSKLSMALLK